jgi:hypothetical protein
MSCKLNVEDMMIRTDSTLIPHRVLVDLVLVNSSKQPNIFKTLAEKNMLASEHFSFTCMYKSSA